MELENSNTISSPRPITEVIYLYPHFFYLLCLTCTFFFLRYPLFPCLSAIPGKIKPFPLMVGLK